MPIAQATLTLSPAIPLRLYTLPYWSNPPFLIFDIRALWRSGLSARASECQKIKMVGQTSMVLDPSKNSSLEQLVLKGLSHTHTHPVPDHCLYTRYAARPAQFSPHESCAHHWGQTPITAITPPPANHSPIANTSISTPWQDCDRQMNTRGGCSRTFKCSILETKTRPAYLFNILTTENLT